MTRFLIGVICGSLVACGPIAPATPPSQLGATPGPVVVLTGDRYISKAFSAALPTGWQVVTSPTFADPWVVFTSPDETAVIVLALDPDDTAVQPPNAKDFVERKEQTIMLEDGRAVYAVLVTAASATDAKIFGHVIASVK